MYSTRRENIEKYKLLLDAVRVIAEDDIALSYSDMQEVYEKLKEAVPYKVLVQNAGSSQTDILKEFKRDVNAS